MLEGEKLEQSRITEVRSKSSVSSGSIGQDVCKTEALCVQFVWSPAFHVLPLVPPGTSPHMSRSPSLGIMEQCLPAAPLPDSFRSSHGFGRQRRHFDLDIDSIAPPFGRRCVRLHSKARYVHHIALRFILFVSVRKMPLGYFFPCLSLVKTPEDAVVSKLAYLSNVFLRVDFQFRQCAHSNFLVWLHNLYLFGIEEFYSNVPPFPHRQLLN
jgi:hypothetical protein